MGYKDPAFQDRIASAAAAKQRALDRLKAKPQPTEAELAERAAAREAKERAEADKRAAKLAARQAEKEAAEAAKAAMIKAKPTAEELKAARDARYAARKGRK